MLLTAVMGFATSAGQSKDAFNIFAAKKFLSLPFYVVSYFSVISKYIEIDFMRINYCEQVLQVLYMTTKMV